MTEHVRIETTLPGGSNAIAHVRKDSIVVAIDDRIAAVHRRWMTLEQARNLAADLVDTRDRQGPAADLEAIR